MRRRFGRIDVDMVDVRDFAFGDLARTDELQLVCRCRMVDIDFIGAAETDFLRHAERLDDGCERQRFDADGLVDRFAEVAQVVDDARFVDAECERALAHAEVVRLVMVALRIAARIRLAPFVMDRGNRRFAGDGLQARNLAFLRQAVDRIDICAAGLRAQARRNGCAHCLCRACRVCPGTCGERHGACRNDCDQGEFPPRFPNRVHRYCVHAVFTSS